MNKLFPSATAALQGVVKDGQLMAVGGFGLCGIPETLIGALNSELAQTDALKADTRRNVRVLIKGSRGSAMDKIVKAVLVAAGEGDTDAA